MDSSSDEALVEDNSSTSVFRTPTFSGLNLFQNLKAEYHEIIDNPKRLPFFLHPMISQSREFSITGERQYFTPSILFNDHHNVPRRIFFNFDAQNVGVGATGGLLVGLTTRQYFKGHGQLATMAMRAWLNNTDYTSISTRLQKFAYSSSVVSRVVKRGLMGAVCYDLLKRNAELERGKEDWMNVAFAGLVCGGAFGLRGGLQTAVLGGVGFSLCATVHHFFPELQPFKG